MANPKSARDQAISILRSAIAAIADDTAVAAASSTDTPGSPRSTARDARLALDGRDITTLADACNVLARRFTSSSL
ncbi:MAG: hypothetical protein QM698_11485 [Micropepsaceae bacterium]